MGPIDRCVWPGSDDKYIQIPSSSTETDSIFEVYNCKSDTESPAEKDDIVMSVTCFTNVPVTFAVIYGCTTDTMDDIKDYLKDLTTWTSHHMLLPMVFIELERRRLLNSLENEGWELRQRILRMEQKLQEEAEGKSPEKEGNQELTLRDCKATKLVSEFQSNLVVPF
jgi:hypothetical protein